MKLKSIYSSEIDSLKADCVKILAFNAERVLSQDVFDEFVEKLTYLVDILSNKESDFYFCKR